MQVTLNHISYKKKAVQFAQFFLTFGALLWMMRLVSFGELLSIEFGTNRYTLFLSIVVFLMPINWLLEAKKWQLLVGINEDLSLREAVYQVLNGVLYSWILPFTSGDVLARMERNTHKLKAGKAILINRLASFVTAGFFGIVGVLSYFKLADGFIPFVAVFVIIYLVHLWLTTKGKTLESTVLLLSVIRFLVITVQFFILIRLFTQEGSAEWVFSGISWVFLIRSILPSVWGALGVREVSAVLFFGCCIENEVILSSSLLLWSINLVMVTFIFSIVKMTGLFTLRAVWS